MSRNISLAQAQFERVQRTIRSPGGSGGVGTAYDAFAVHSNIAGELPPLSIKGTPVDGDMFLIEDSANGNIKKRVLFSAITKKVTTADEVSDSTTYPMLGNDLVATQQPKTNAALKFNTFTGDLRATRHGGIVEANLVDLSDPETITGAWAFDDITLNAGSVDIDDHANATQGDLLAWDGASAPTTLGIGASGRVLTSNGTSFSWQPSAGGGGGDHILDGGGAADDGSSGWSLDGGGA